MAVHQQRQTGWVGWIAFASVMLLIGAALHAIIGLVALLDDEYFLVTKNGLVVSVDYAAWGWAHLLIGVIMATAGASLLRGHMYGRVLGTFVAAGSTIANVAFLAAYPVWAMLIIALDVIVIYSIIVHGRELEA